MKILIVDDDEITLDIIEHILRTAGHETRTAADGREGLRAFDDFQPELVITDIEMPEMNGLELLAAIRQKREETIVVMATGRGSEEYALQALRARANNYLRKPIDQANLLELIQKYAVAVETRLEERIVSKFITRSEVSMIFGNCVNQVHLIVDYLCNQASGLLPQDEMPMLRFGLGEMIANAIEHGNLGITYDMKTKAQERLGGFHELIEQRTADPRFSQRCVTVKSKMDRESCEWVITDEGEGFDWQALPEEFTAESLFVQHGRGVLLTRLQFDELEYSGKGNEVRLKKNARQSP